MKSLPNVLRLAAVAAALVAISGALSAQEGVTSNLLLHPPPHTWPGYHGDYSGRRHSALRQITPENVENLGLAWAFQTGQRDTIKSSPLVVDGIMYFTVPDDVWAVDARSGHEIWHYKYRNKGFHIGHRGVAMYKDWLFFVTPDALLVSLNAVWHGSLERGHRRFTERATGPLWRP